MKRTTPQLVHVATQQTLHCTIFEFHQIMASGGFASQRLLKFYNKDTMRESAAHGEPDTI
jgi:hypothetical protein